MPLRNRRVYQKHRDWVRTQPCSIMGCRRRPVDFAHLRTAANSGIGLKPSDMYGIPLCREHHARAHLIGHASMAQENGMTLEALFKIAAELARLSPDLALQAMLRDE